MTAGTDYGQPPPPAQSTKYLGVPDDYAKVIAVPAAAGVSVFDSNPSMRNLPPIYQTGDEYSVASMPPEQLARLQQAMATAGLIGPSTKIRVGLADEATVDAFKDLLSYANVNGMSWSVALAQLQQHPVSTGGAASGDVTVANPATEDAALRDAAQRLMGRDPTPQQLNDFRPYYNALIAGPTQTTSIPRSTSMIGSQETPQTLTVAPPSPADAAEDFLKKNAGVQVQAENLSHVMDMMGGIINGAGGRIDFGADRNS